jgi:hypothetical protein
MNPRLAIIFLLPVCRPNIARGVRINQFRMTGSG